MTDRHGALLDIRLAADGQLRFPPSDSLPTKLATCLVLYEDEHFYRHPGVNPGSLAKALWLDMRTGRAARGGSTLSMQVCRMAGGLNTRSLPRKALEIVQATRLEATHSKVEILNLYLAHAPFGGNVVGAEAAAWRLFGKGPGSLTWAQAALLAVLPTAPAKVHLGRRADRLLARRNFLLGKLKQRGRIDDQTYRLSLLEPLPGTMMPLPHGAPHLVEEARLLHPKGSRLATGIDPRIQRQVESATLDHLMHLAPFGICQASVVVASTRTGRVLAWAGNLAGCSGTSTWVHLAVAPRSYGSLLKPFLYGKALDEGLITPKSWLEDVPRIYGTFAPKNYYNTYEGVVPASEALARSLNLPYVGLLDQYGTTKFLGQMRQAGLHTLNRPASHYGLSLILGGGESRLMDLAGAYRNLGATLLNVPPTGIEAFEGMQASSTQKGLLSKLSVWFAFEALRNATRPELDPAWATFAARQTVAWKTGTSAGFKDAWAIGVTPEYTIAVWTGNADGEGRTGNTGIKTAAPLMLSLFSRLGARGWFQKPEGLSTLRACAVTGWRAGAHCPATQEQEALSASAKAPLCPYHVQAFTEASGRFRADGRCAAPGTLKPISILQMNPLQAWYARRLHALPAPLPWMPGCQTSVERGKEIAILYPTPDSRLVLPEGKQDIVVHASSLKNTGLTWHLDGAYAGATTSDHRVSLKPGTGIHTLTVSDAEGNMEEVTFEVGREK